jgi:hypothetical protein
MPLTGRFTLRRTIGGKIVLQVEEEVKRLWPFSRWHPTKRRWRDATIMDLAQPELRPLMDLRYKPGFEWLRIYGEPRGALQTGVAGMSSEDSLSNAAVSSQPHGAGACLTTQRRMAA